MPEHDYYQILGVARNATPEQIKSAYRKMAKRYHPDRNRNDKSAESRFKEIHEAYEVLNDPAKRRAYDQFGAAGMSGGGPHAGWRPGPGGARTHTWGTRGGGETEIPIEGIEDLFSVFGGGLGGENAGPFDDFFRRATGRSTSGRRRRPPPTPAERDVQQEVVLSFEEAIHGTHRDVPIAYNGQVGQVVSVKIPAGVRDGQRIRLHGKGRPSEAGEPAGDLYIVCRIQPHRFFRRVDNDIYLDLPLSITEAALGTKVEIPTLEGKTVLTVPPCTPSGAKLRLKEQGVKPPGNKPSGHLYAVVRIVPPKSLTPDQRELLRRFSELGDESPRGNTGW